MNKKLSFRGTKTELIEVVKNFIDCAVQNYDFLESRIETFVNRTDPQRWRAEIGETYYYICRCGHVSELKRKPKVESFNENFVDAEYLQYCSGNYYRTRDEAYAHAKLVKEAYAAEVENIG